MDITDCYFFGLLSDKKWWNACCECAVFVFSLWFCVCVDMWLLVVCFYVLCCVCFVESFVR